MKRNLTIANVRIVRDGVTQWSIRLGLGLLILLASVSSLYAQQGTLRFRRISPEQGLAHSKVYSIIQDRKGFLWFGTENGLNKYDGYNFVLYKNDPANPNSLSHNRIMSLLEDSQGILWIGTLGGLNKFDPASETFTQYQADPANPNSLSHNTIWTIYEDPSGTLWFGTLGGGLNKFDRETGQFSHYQADPGNPHSLTDNSVLSIYEDRAGALWVGTAKGLNRFERDTGNFIYYQANPADPNSLSHNQITFIFEDHLGELWIGTASGLNVFDRKTEQFRRYLPDRNNPYSLSSNAISAVHEDPSGQLWITTLGGGLNKFERETGRFFRYFSNPNDPNSLSHNEIWTLCEDHSGMLWLGTLGGGVSAANPKTEQFKHYQADMRDPNSLSHNDVRAMYEDHEGILWIGTSGGLNKIDRENGQITRYLANPNQPGSLSYNGVWSVYEDREGVLWVGTLNGLNKFDRATETFIQYRPNAADPHSLSFHKIGPLYEDRSGMLWIGTLGGGLDKFDRVQEQFTRYLADPADPHSLTHNVVSAIYEDQDGTFWIGTNGGLNQFEREAERFIQYQNDPENPQSLSSNAVLSIHADQAGTLWVGTSGGLNAFNRTDNTFTRYFERDGLPSDVIYGILEDAQGNLWFSTNKGLARFDPKSGRFKNFDTRDGLQSDELNFGAAYQNARGEMFLGSVKGLTIFDPAQIKENTHVPPVVITDFQLFNKSVIPGQDPHLQQPITATKEIKLSYKDDVFSFEFVSMDYTIPEKNQYAFMLEGFNKDWIPTTPNRRFATFTNLDGGNYVFRVKGSNNDGVWNEAGASIRLIVSPPPWKTWWAYTLYVLTAIGMVLGYVQYKQMQYKRERAILDRFVPYEYLGFLGKKSILDVQLGDHISSETMAVMFSDIRSFTTISETMTPKENFDFVNAYLRRVAPVIRGNEGFIVKFLGDGMMAVFPNGAEDGVKAAVEKLTQVREYNEHRQQDGWKPINVGIGVHTGHMMVGMVGEKARMQGDAFSDNVNLTARLEGLTKYYGVAFLISEETYKAIDPSQYHIRFLDNVAVKGKELPIKIYEIFDADPQELFEKKCQIMPDFEEAQRLYFDRQFEAALQLFKKVLDVIPDDLTTQLYVERCETFIKEGVPEDWDGVRKMDKK